MSIEIGNLRTRVSGSDGPAAADSVPADDGGATAHDELARLQAAARRLERDRMRTRAEGFDD